MNVYQMSIEELIKNSNAVKEELLGALEREGLLKRPAAEIAAQYAVILRGEGWFGALFRKISGAPPSKNDLICQVVKTV